MCNFNRPGREEHHKLSRTSSAVLSHPSHIPTEMGPQNAPKYDQCKDSKYVPPVRPENEAIRPTFQTRHTSPSVVEDPSTVSLLHTKAREEALQRTLKISSGRSALFPHLPQPVPVDARDPRKADKQSLPNRQDILASSPQSSQPPSLSVFNSPTATYMWPGLQAASQMGNGPVIYVNYRNQPRSSSDSRPSSTRPDPDSGLSNTESPELAFLPQKRRPSSDISAPETTSVNRLIEPFKRVYISSHPPIAGMSLEREKGIFYVPPLQTPQPSGSISTSVSLTDCDSTARSSSEGSNRVSETRDVLPNIVPHPAARSSSKREEWEQYVIPQTGDDGKPCFGCLWESCHYVGKKQLMKRHVETKHLKYKRYVCSVCGKAFPQKTSLDTHMHGHTGSTPHECRYGCGRSFKDPARRHRHMVDEHGYVPRQSKKKYKDEIPPLQEPSHYESMQPWTLDAKSKSASRGIQNEGTSRS